MVQVTFKKIKQNVKDLFSVFLRFSLHGYVYKCRTILRFLVVEPLRGGRGVNPSDPLRKTFFVNKRKKCEPILGVSNLALYLLSQKIFLFIILIPFTKLAF